MCIRDRKENNYTRGGYTFTGWNTKADGSGDSYKTGDWITMTGSVILYAQWTRNSSHGGDDDDKMCIRDRKES